MSSSFSSRPNHPHDVEVLYTMTAPVVEINTARRGVNHQWLQLDKIRTTPASLILEVREHIAVELRTEGNNISLECSCQAYRPGRHCGHCFWALDQVPRASADPNLPNIPCNIRSDGTIVTAATSDGYIRPRSIAESIGKKAIKKAIERHTYAKVNFKVVVDRVDEQARQSLLWLSEQEMLTNFAAREDQIVLDDQILTIGGGRSRTATTAHRDLQKYAEELLHAYEAYIHLIRRTDDLDEEYRAATGTAMKTYLSMMKSILVHRSAPGNFSIRSIAARALYEDEGHGLGGYFWYTVHCFFRRVKEFDLRLDPEQVDELQILKEFLDRTTNGHGTAADTSVSQLVEKWQLWEQ